MNTNLLAIVKQIVAEQGEAILDSPQRLKAFFADIARDEAKPQKNAFLKCVEMKFPQALRNASAAERGECKKALAKRLHEEEGLDVGVCEEAVELLAAVLLGEAAQVGNACKNCGKEMQTGWSSCPFCGTAVAAGQPPQETPQEPVAKFAAERSPPLFQAPGEYPPGYVPQKKSTVLLLCIFLGYLGVHRFYTGKGRSRSGIVTLVFLSLPLIGIGIDLQYAVFGPFAEPTAGGLIGIGVYGLAIWWIVDIVRICLGKFTGKQGYYSMKFKYEDTNVEV